MGAGPLRRRAVDRLAACRSPCWNRCRQADGASPSPSSRRASPPEVVASIALTPLRARAFLLHWCLAGRPRRDRSQADLHSASDRHPRPRPNPVRLAHRHPSLDRAGRRRRLVPLQHEARPDPSRHRQQRHAADALAFDVIATRYAPASSLEVPAWPGGHLALTLPTCRNGARTSLPDAASTLRLRLCRLVAMATARCSLAFSAP